MHAYIHLFLSVTDTGNDLDELGGDGCGLGDPINVLDGEDSSGCLSGGAGDPSVEAKNGEDLVFMIEEELRFAVNMRKIMISLIPSTCHD